MRKTLLYRPMMIVTGILAVVVILLSQSLYYEAQSKAEKATTEKTTDQEAPETFISAPSDAVTNSSLEEVNEQVPSLLEELVTDEKETKSVTVRASVLIAFFHTLFRTIISPNAP